jgi:cell division septation protein DedD
VKRNHGDGELLWRANSEERSNVRELDTHPRGILLLSDGVDGSVSYLRHPDSGEEMAKAAAPYAGEQQRIMDTLWVYGEQENLMYSRSFQLNAMEYSGLGLLRTTELNLPGELVTSEWYDRDEVVEDLSRSLGFWTVHRKNVNLGERDAFVIKEEEERTILPNHSVYPKRSGGLFLDRQFLLSKQTLTGAVWGTFDLSGNGNALWAVSGLAHQLPLWLPRQFNGSYVSSADGWVISLDPSSGEVDTLVGAIGGMTVDLMPEGEGFVLVSTEGIREYALAPEVEQPEPEPEPEVVEEPVAPAVTAPVPAAPEPEVEKPEPEPEPEFVDGFRIQIMYLTRTSRSAVDRLATEAERKLGLPVVVISRSGALLMQAGSFVEESKARSALSRVRSLGYRDAFLVREEIERP